MWPYKDVTREEFERAKDKVELLIKEFGGRAVDIPPPYVQRTESVAGKQMGTHLSARSAFELNDEYFRVDEVCLYNKPSIVIECGSYGDLIHNTMEDADPFPFDLPEQELLEEVMISLGLKDA